MERPNEAEENAYDEFIEQLIQQNRELLEQQSTSNTKASDYPAVYIPDYTKDLKQLYEQLNRLNFNYQKENISALFAQIDEKIDAMPKVIPVRHHHHFAPKFKWILVAYFFLVIAVSVLTGTSIGFATEAYLLKKEIATRQVDQPTSHAFSAIAKTIPSKMVIKRKSRIRKTTLKGKQNCQTKFVTP